MEGKAITFSFSKKVEKKNLLPSALRGSALSKDVNNTETIECIEENVIKSNGPQQAELVIPLLEEDRASAIDALRKRVAQRNRASTAVGAKEETSANQDRKLTLDERAEQALLQEARDYAAVPPQRDPGTIEGAGAAGEGAGECSTLDDYDEVGVECFGTAMLRGMGWNNDGVGRPKVRKVVAIVGAVNKTLSAVATRVPASSSCAAPGPEEDGLPLVKGAFVIVRQGRHRGTYGVVEEVEVEYLLVRRALARSVGGEAVLREVPANVTVVTAAHYKNNSRLINKEMFDQAQCKDKLKSERRKKRRSSDSNDSSDADIEDKTDLEETRSLVKTEVLTDHATDNSSLANQRVKKESVEIQNTAGVDTLDDGNNSNSNDKTTVITSKNPLADSSYKDVKEGEDSAVTVSGTNKNIKAVLVDQTNSSLSGREENVSSYRNNGTEDRLKCIDTDGKYLRHRSDPQSPDRRRHSPDRRRQSSNRRRQSPDRRRQSPDRRRQSADRRRQSPDRLKRLRQSPDRRRHSADRRSQSPERRRHSRDRRRQSPGVQSIKIDTKGSSQSNDSPKSNEEERHQRKKSRSANPDPSSQHRKHDSQKKEVEIRDKKEDYLSSKYGDASSNARPGVGSGQQLKERASAPWVREGLTVRIISEDYRRGRYFKQKVHVLSVLTAASCECRTELGKVLRDVPPSCLETVIPKQQPRLVLVLRGQLSGQLAIILEQHKDDQEASVQLLEDRSVIARLSYEDICQYSR